PASCLLTMSILEPDDESIRRGRDSSSTLRSLRVARRDDHQPYDVMESRHSCTSTRHHRRHGDRCLRRDSVQKTIVTGDSWVNRPNRAVARIGCTALPHSDELAGVPTLPALTSATAVAAGWR